MTSKIYRKPKIYKIECRRKSTPAAVREVSRVCRRTIERLAPQPERVRAAFLKAAKSEVPALFLEVRHSNIDTELRRSFLLAEIRAQLHCYVRKIM